MEGLAIAILVMILILGGAIFMVFLQFLQTTRENRVMHRRLMDEIGALGKKVEGLRLNLESKTPPDSVD